MLAPTPTSAGTPRSCVWWSRGAWCTSRPVLAAGRSLGVRALAGGATLVPACATGRARRRGGAYVHQPGLVQGGEVQMAAGLEHVGVAFVDRLDKETMVLARLLEAGRTPVVDDEVVVADEGSVVLDRPLLDRQRLLDENPAARSGSSEEYGELEQDLAFCAEQTREHEMQVEAQKESARKKQAEIDKTHAHLRAHTRRRLARTSAASSSSSSPSPTSSSSSSSSSSWASSAAALPERGVIARTGRRGATPSA